MSSLSLREPRMMLRLCNVNRCGLYNYSCLSSGGACFSFTRAQLSMGCSQGGRSFGKTAAAWAAVPGMVPRESPPSQAGTVLGCQTTALGFPCVQTQIKIAFPGQGNIFLPFEEKKNPFCRKVAGLGWLTVYFDWLRRSCQMLSVGILFPWC